LIVLSAGSVAAGTGSGFDPYNLGNNGLGLKAGDKVITRAEASADLDTLTKMIDENSAYIWSSTFDYRASLHQLAAALPEQVSVSGLAVQLDRFIHLFGDDHAKVSELNKHVTKGGIPFQIGKSGSRYFLYNVTKGTFADAEHPYVRSIDGVTIEEWMRAAGDIGQGPLSSPAARFGRAQALFPSIDRLRGVMGLPMGGPAALQMVSEDGSQVAPLSVPLEASLGKFGHPFGLPEESRMLEHNIGYLRVAAHQGEISEKLVADIPRLMQEFRNTDALIIDARQCGGGKRAVLNALFPYFMRADAAPYVFNVVKLRKSQIGAGQDAASMFDDEDKKFEYIGDKDLPKADLAAYRAFAANFVPMWTPPADKFTDWYFMALHPQAGKPFYAKPVYVLIDWGIGSAGDIFTSAFKNWPGVTLVGTPTMGRSGQSRPFHLPNSGLDVVISTMASFQKNGQRYDTIGIQPDIAIEPIPSDWIGKSDSVLDRAQALILQHANKSSNTAPQKHK